MNKWFILDREGHEMPESDLPERPQDARAAEGDAFRPWFKEDEHIHIEGGKIAGIHGFGTIEVIQGRLNRYLEHEDDLLRHFGRKEDILVGLADNFLANLQP